MAADGFHFVAFLSLSFFCPASLADNTVSSCMIQILKNNKAHFFRAYNQCMLLRFNIYFVKKFLQKGKIFVQKIKAAIFLHYGELVWKAGDFTLHLQQKDVVLFV